MKSLLYVPYLRRESAPTSLPSEVLFMDSGMNAMQGAAYSSGANNSPEEQGALWTSPRLPFAPDQAKHVLNDLLQYGENVGMFGDLQSMAAGMAENERKLSRMSTTRREMKELELFELDGFADEDADAVSDEARAQLLAEAKALEEAEAAKKEAQRLEAAQKTLLLAWHLEGSALELDALRDSFTAGRELLMETMGVEEDELSELMGFAGVGGLPSRQGTKGTGSFLSQDGIGSLPDQDPFTADLAGSGLDVLRPSWRSLLENMLPFMPDDAVLVTSDAAMVEAMQEFGVTFTAVDTDNKLQAEFELFAGTPRAQAQVANGPMWRLLGLKAPVVTKPWLDREFSLIAVAYL